jgi:hypothetical protein
VRLFIRLQRVLGKALFWRAQTRKAKSIEQREYTEKWREDNWNKSRDLAVLFTPPARLYSGCKLNEVCNKMTGKLITILVGVFIAVVSWVPLWIVEARDPHAMPVGLGLFAFATSFVGGVIALVGLVRLVIHASRRGAS